MSITTTPARTDLQAARDIAAAAVAMIERARVTLRPYLVDSPAGRVSDMLRLAICYLTDAIAEADRAANEAESSE